MVILVYTHIYTFYDDHLHAFVLHVVILSFGYF